MTAVKTGIMGCGVISEIYCKNLKERFHSIELVGCADMDAGRAEARASQFGIRACTPEEMLSDDNIELIVNLTNPAAHAGVILKALAAGKHVFTEKPLALTNEDADAILEESHRRGRLVGCAPDTILGAGLQTALRAVETGWIGEALSAVAFWSSRGHERWHASPLFYYQKGGGPHLDMGPYYISALTMLMGPMRSVMAKSGRGYDSRVYGAGKWKGQRFPVEIDTHYSVLLETCGGAIINLMLSFDVWANNLPRMEIYGTSGTLSVPDPNTFDGPVRLYTPASGRFEELPLVNPFRENARGIGAAQMAKCIREGGEYAANAEFARHVLEVMLAIEESARTGKRVECRTRCRPPKSLPLGLTEAEWNL